MAALQIKGLPDDVHEELRRRAGAQGMTLRDYVLALILADQALPPRQEWLARVRARRPVVPAQPIADAVARDRAGRDRHQGVVLSEEERPDP